MKKIKIAKKLSLNKETIIKLNKQELTSLIGGGTNGCAPNTAPCTTETIGYTNCGCPAQTQFGCPATHDC